jgi:hypothetical protein
MLKVMEIRAADYIGENMPLLRMNWAETGFGFDFAPDVAMIDRMQQLGVMFVLGAFDGDELVGYCSALVSPHHYNPEIICCNSDALFVREDKRCTSLAYRLVDTTERIAKDRGATMQLWHTRAGTPFANMLERRGYEPADTTVMKRI